MNKRIKLLPIFIVLLILGTMFTFTAYATAENPGGDAPVVSTPDPGPVTPDPGPVTPDPGPVTPDPGPVTSDPTPGDTPVTSDPVISDPGTGTDTPVTSDPVTSTPSSGYIGSDTDDGYYYYDEDTMVNNIEGYAGNVSDYTTLYDTSDFNETALKEQKWNNITIDTSKTPSDNAAMDFSAIKDNTSADDDGEWMLYTGYVLIGLALCGILYYIIATATYNKKVKALASRKSYHSDRTTHERSRDDYGDSEYPTTRNYNQRYRSKNRRYATDNRSYAERKRSSKADTAEIHLR